MTAFAATDATTSRTYTHTAFLYESADELITALARFVRDGIDADEHVLVVVDRAKAEMLVGRLGSAEGFDLADSADVYVSPTRTLANFIDTIRESTADGRAMRVAGEPIWAGLDSVQVAEWTCLESACNVAFADSPLTMLCPYDVSVLDPAIVFAARQTHPELRRRDTAIASEDFVDPHQFHVAVRHTELPPPREPLEEFRVDSIADLARVQSIIEGFTEFQAISSGRVGDLVASVNDVIGAAFGSDAGPMTVGLWLDRSNVMCDLTGSWTAPAPFAGLLAQPSERDGSPGLWSAGHRCDLLAIREHEGLTTVRLQIPTRSVSVSPTCAEVAEFLGVYVLGACEPDEIVMIEAHLAECLRCRAEYDELAAVVAALSAQRVTAMPPPPRPGDTPPHT